MSSTGRVPVHDPLPEVREKGVGDQATVLEPMERPDEVVAKLQLFLLHRKFLLRVGIIAALASALIAILVPVRYESLTRLMPPDGQSGALGMLAAMMGHPAGGSGSGSGSGGSPVSSLGALAGDLLGVKSSGALFMGIINSQTVQDRLIDQFNLKKVYGTSKIEDARKVLATHTDVTEDRKSGIITIVVTDHDAKRAAAMAQAYVTELDRLVAQVSTSSARRERIFLESRLQTVKAEWDVAARKFSDFASKNTAIDIPEQGKAMVGAAATLQGYLIAAESELKGLQQIYSDNNFRVRATQARVQELRNKLNELGGGDGSSANGENSLYPSIRKLPVLGVTYVDLFRQAKIEEAVYELLTQQCELAKVEEAKEIPSVKILDPALVPTKKSFPPRSFLTILGTILGLAAAMGWLIAKERWDAVDARNPRKLLATEVFSMVRAGVTRFTRNGASAESNGQQSWNATDRSSGLDRTSNGDADGDTRRSNSGRS